MYDCCKGGLEVVLGQDRVQTLRVSTICVYYLWFSWLRGSHTVLGPERHARARSRVRISAGCPAVLTGTICDPWPLCKCISSPKL